MKERGSRNRKLNVVLLVILAVVTLAMALVKLLPQTVVGFDIKPEEIVGYAQETLGWDGLTQTDSAEGKSYRVLVYRLEDGSTAAAAFSKGLINYKLAATLEPGTGERPLEVDAPEDWAEFTVGADGRLTPGESGQQTWFGLVVINLILCGVALFTARRQRRLMLAEQSGTEKK